MPPESRVERRWVLVTGGARRLGCEIVLAFARAGWNVACHHHRSVAEAAALERQVRALGADWRGVRGPLDSEADAEQVFAQALEAVPGQLACVVNNASTFLPDGAADFQAAGMLRQLQTNLVVPLVLARLLHRQAGTAGADVSVVQLLDQKVYNLNPDYFSYTLTKLALERSVAQLAQALAPRLRVNAVAPGLMYQSGPQSAENFAAAASANLLKRPVDPAQVAETVRFLADNPCITGVTVCVDNGQHLVPLPRDIMCLVDELMARLPHGPV